MGRKFATWIVEGIVLTALAIIFERLVSFEAAVGTFVFGILLLLALHNLERLEEFAKRRPVVSLTAFIIIPAAVGFGFWLWITLKSSHPAQRGASEHGERTATSEGGTAASPSSAVSSPSPSIPVKVYEPPIERTSKFTVMIPFDTALKAAPIPTDENMADPLWKMYGDLQSLAKWGTMPDSVRDTTDQGQITWAATPVSVEQAPDFLAKVLQYYVFHNLDSLQHDSMTLTLGAPAEASAGIEPPDAERYSYKKLSKELSDSPFFRPFRHRPSGDDMAWKMKASKFPKGMEIRLVTEQPDRYLVRFQRPKYFKADFIV